MIKRKMRMRSLYFAPGGESILLKSKIEKTAGKR
jgi:hypothetical protein